MKTGTLVTLLGAAAIAAAILTAASLPAGAPASASAGPALHTLPVALPRPQSANPRPAMSPLRRAVIAFYGAPDAVRDAFVFDTCYRHGGGAREHWLGRKGRRSYDRIGARLTAAYLADPRDSAVEQLERDFCRAAKGRK